jgi:hypothetical protein
MRSCHAARTMRAKPSTRFCGRVAEPRTRRGSWQTISSTPLRRWPRSTRIRCVRWPTIARSAEIVWNWIGSDSTKGLKRTKWKPDDVPTLPAPMLAALKQAGNQKTTTAEGSRCQQLMHCRVRSLALRPAVCASACRLPCSR